MLDDIGRQNRWWRDPGAIELDYQLARARAARVQWRPPVAFRFDRDALYTLRGPRQVGKSTAVKYEIARLIASGWPATSILYLDAELAGLRGPADLVAALRTFLDRRPPQAAGAAQRLAVFVDEVTRVENWGGALRGLIDNGELVGVTLVATGSHTRDLRRGGERLPGRRGGGAELDLELLPLGFREYVALVEPALLPAPVPWPTPEELRRGAAARAPIRPRLAALLDGYLTSGGFLPALNDVAGHGMIRPETFALYRDAIVGEFTRAGLRESYLRELVDFLAGHLGQEFSDGAIAADTDIGSKTTARGYVDTMVDCYLAAVVHRTNRLDRLAPAFRAPRKLHPTDPLLWHLLRAWAAGDPDPWPAVVADLASPREVGHLVESVVAVHLRRAFGDRLFYWRPDERAEVDFVVGSGQERPALLEAKYVARVDRADAAALVKLGGGLLVTRGWSGDLADGRVHALPAAELLALTEAPALAPSRP
jgi:hypothetical protein